MLLNVLTQDGSGAPATIDDAATWRARFDLTFEVLADSEGEWIDTWGTIGNWSQRSYVIIGTDYTIAWRQGDGSPADAETIIAEAEAAP